MPDTHAPQQLEPWQWSEAQWRKLVGHCFAAPPNFEHVAEVLRGF